MSTVDPSSCKVALLAGGRSGEREISLLSAEGAKAALQEAGFEVVQLDPAVRDDLKALIDGDFDVAFLCTHGRYGEDGSLQGFLELIDLPYTCPGVLASAMAMDKDKAKLVYRNADIPTPVSVTLVEGDGYDLDAIISVTGERTIVKAANEGSTIGIFKAHGREELQEAIENAFSFDAEVLVERFIEGREYTVAVIGNDDARPLPVIEIIPASGFYDYEAKYAPGGSRHVCPAEISDEAAQEIQRLALRAHKALGCVGVSRTDFIMDEQGGCFALETNTIPGMTKTSLLPETARVSGMPFSELCTYLIECAFKAKKL
ncbi:MAG: D-alanine--D-alanine ligase [Eggerthellaceae bacterium]|nr:D-alanine--D-alanine ligase [Eggerthellaceae bacterium]